MIKLCVSISCALPVMLVACGGGGADGGEGGGDGTSGGEAAYEGPVGSTDTAAGQTAFDNACAPCHDGSGGAPAIDGIGWTAAKVRQQIREGSGQMPPISAGRLSDADMEHVLAYLQSVGGVQ